MTDLKLAAQKALEAMTALRESALDTIATASGWEASLDTCADEAEAAIIALRSALQHQEEREPATVTVPVEAYRWLMGCGNDAFIPDRQGAFWWRGKFNELAGLDVRDYMGLSTPPLLQKEEGDGPCWLVEKRKDGRTVGYLGHACGSYEWMPTPDKATRFMRRQDANGVAECIETEDVIIAEHIWG